MDNVTHDCKFPELRIKKPCLAMGFSDKGKQFIIVVWRGIMQNKTWYSTVAGGISSTIAGPDVTWCRRFEVVRVGRARQ